MQADSLPTELRGKLYMLYMYTNINPVNPKGIRKGILKEIKPVSTLKEINPEYTSEGLMLKLQYFGQRMLQADSLEKTLMLGKIGGKNRRE